mmetsp:Transcript_38794/g.91751  ORF Transcript_38794/g.91751 Transcript_38794/m.91751 type:complete len:208 (-) Transcript_38794:126-749(-)
MVGEGVRWRSAHRRGISRQEVHNNGRSSLRDSAPLRGPRATRRGNRLPRDSLTLLRTPLGASPHPPNRPPLRLLVHVSSIRGAALICSAELGCDAAAPLSGVAAESGGGGGIKLPPSSAPRLPASAPRDPPVPRVSDPPPPSPGAARHRADGGRQEVDTPRSRRSARAARRGKQAGDGGSAGSGGPGAHWRESGHLRDPPWRGHYAA